MTNWTWAMSFPPGPAMLWMVLGPAARSITRWQNSVMAERTRGYALRVDIDAEAPRVWQVLIERRCMERWCAPDARLTPRAGGSFSVSFERNLESQAHIDVFDAGRRIRLIYLPTPAMPAGESAVVDDIILEARPPQTVVRILGSGFDAGPAHEAAARRHQLGWRAALARLKVYIEKNLDRVEVPS
ncbi:MAG: SRPBCC domain-containing protein [Steroidobacteraceae bacterium]